MEPEQKSNGALIGSMIIIVILIIGGIYLWKTGLQEKPEPLAPGLPEGINGSVQNSDEENAVNIEAELNDIDLEDLDKGI